MYCEDSYIGCHLGIGKIKNKLENLNVQVASQINECQELVMLNNFARETNESHLKRCIEQRIADIASWQWVLEDLGKRLDDAKNLLLYELNALKVVVDRIDTEIKELSQRASKPGALSPLSDPVEEAIIQEYNYLRTQKSAFESYVEDLQNQIKTIDVTKQRIDEDIDNKKKAVSVEEACAYLRKQCDNVYCKETCKKSKKKKKASSLQLWESRCMCLKKSGLKSLSSAIVTRQQLRGARAYLSVAAQTYADRVESAIRRRLHTNRIKLQDLEWQKEEAARDMTALEDELLSTEKNILETMEQERMADMRLKERSQKPDNELTKDEVDKQLKEEMGRLKIFRIHLQKSIERITTLKNNLMRSMLRIDSCIADIKDIITLDEKRLRGRSGDFSGDEANVPQPEDVVDSYNDNESTHVIYQDLTDSINTEFSGSNIDFGSFHVSTPQFQLPDLSIITEEDEDEAESMEENED